MIGAIILGLLAGFIAKALMPGDDPGGFFVTILLGLAGSLVGFFLFTEVLGIGDDKIFDLGGLLGASCAPMPLLGISRLAGAPTPAPPRRVKPSPPHQPDPSARGHHRGRSVVPGVVPCPPPS